ncbi:hypothetical protein GQ42DRAFT_157088 [Ramicandelaber brevisporus]|nr:hypothetical protein GQ42DRAFT_157088 [Ramicandelaber brevisporus]
MRVIQFLSLIAVLAAVAHSAPVTEFDKNTLLAAPHDIKPMTIAQATTVHMMPHVAAAAATAAEATSAEAVASTYAGQRTELDQVVAEDGMNDAGSFPPSPPPFPVTPESPAAVAPAPPAAAEPMQAPPPSPPPSSAASVPVAAAPVYAPMPCHKK